MWLEAYTPPQAGNLVLKVRAVLDDAVDDVGFRSNRIAIQSIGFMGSGMGHGDSESGSIGGLLRGGNGTERGAGSDADSCDVERGNGRQNGAGSAGKNTQI